MNIRDLIDDLGVPETPGDPMRAAQRAMAPRLPKRFYTTVAVGEHAEGVAVLLDGKVPKTPRGQPLAVPSRAVADMLAAEWAAQAAEIDPATMPMTRLVNVTLDGVIREPEVTRAEIVRYAGSDLVCYRAEAPAGLQARQTAAWDPILMAAQQAFGARFVCAAGIIHVAQPPQAIAAVQAAVAGVPPFALGALASMTTLAGSVLIPLAVLRGAVSAEAGWAAAHVDEDWQAEQWGEDDEAMARQAARKREWDAAARLLAAVCDRSVI